MATERPTTPEASQPFGQDNELGGNGADEEPHELHHNLKQLIHDLIDTNFAKFIARSFNSEEWIRQQELFQDPNLASFVTYIVAAIQQLYTILGAFASQFGFKHRTVHYMLLTAHTHTAKAIFRETNRWNFLEHELRSEWQVGWNRMDYIEHVKNRMNEAEQWEQDEWDAEIQRREDNFEKGKVPPIIQRKRVNRMVKGMKACGKKLEACGLSYGIQIVDRQADEKRLKPINVFQVSEIGEQFWQELDTYGFGEDAWRKICEACGMLEAAKDVPAFRGVVRKLIGAEHQQLVDDEDTTRERGDETPSRRARDAQRKSVRESIIEMLSPFSIIKPSRLPNRKDFDVTLQRKYGVGLYLRNVPDLGFTRDHLLNITKSVRSVDNLRAIKKAIREGHVRIARSDPWTGEGTQGPVLPNSARDGAISGSETSSIHDFNFADAPG